MIARCCLGNLGPIFTAVHGAELVDHEGLTAQTCPPLLEQDWPGAFSLHQERHDEEHRKKEEKQDRRSSNIKKPLPEACGSWG
jgi:hypothetical protein